MGEFKLLSRLDLLLEESKQLEFDFIIDNCLEPLSNLKNLGIMVFTQEFEVEKLMNYIQRRKNIIEVRTNVRFDIDLLIALLRERRNCLRFVDKLMYLDILRYLELLAQFPQHEIEITFKNLKKLGFKEF